METHGDAFAELVMAFTERIVYLKDLSVLRSGPLEAWHKELKELGQIMASLESLLLEMRDYIAKEKGFIQGIKELELVLKRQEQRVKHLSTAVAAQPPEKLAEIDRKASFASIESTGDLSEKTKAEPKSVEPKPAQAKPKVLAKIDTNAPKKHNTNDTQRAGKKPTHSSVPSSTFVVPPIRAIAPEEFESVPKLTRGRLSLERVNGAVEDIKKIVDEKYRILNLPLSKMGGGTIKKYQRYKEQQSKEAAMQIFFCEEDVKEAKDISSLSIDATGKAIIAVLRHLGRIKEFGGRDKRFVLL